MARALAAVMALLCATAVPAAPTAAPKRQSLGVFGDWAAFRDGTGAQRRCYAIAMPEYSHGQPRDTHGQAYASIGTWPDRRVRGQVYLMLSRAAAADKPLALRVGRQHFQLVARGAQAWAADPATDRAIVAAMRDANSMEADGHTPDGKRVRDIYRLQALASALDAATLACPAPPSPARR